MEKDNCKGSKYTEHNTQNRNGSIKKKKKKGRSSAGSRIVGGTPAFDPMPWMVVLSISGSQCGGSLINSKFVLTAAHCFCGGDSVEKKCKCNWSC